ncbi:hypothetical protein M413DRAFT_172483 [Hebeloma cylindrosporum]|uniref:Uncharacterized protein n=1 Tax=Hebeloma cylindrosporum TaxID=76867 RepID=A0A0C2XRE8_HEBCY|nr:hypothetical protein M413DRAFT_172483 [Hebeloma cylindrosporum h7]
MDVLVDNFRRLRRLCNCNNDIHISSERDSLWQASIYIGMSFIHIIVALLASSWEAPADDSFYLASFIITCPLRQSGCSLILRDTLSHIFPLHLRDILPQML